MKKKRGGAALMAAMKSAKGLPALPKLPGLPNLQGQQTDSDPKSEPLVRGTINAILTFFRDLPTNMGITAFNFAMFIRGLIVFIQILAVLIMCAIVYIMMHFVLVAINFLIKLIRTILPFLKKKLKLLKEWPHELVLDLLGISFEDEDQKEQLDETESSEDQYCSVK
jgi:hypothetical protein